MSNFIRPEARKALWRWREILAALAVMAVGLWLASGFGLLRWIGGAVTLLGIALALTGLQRLRFRSTIDGPGVVSVEERRLTYFGPQSGGSLSLDELERLDHDATTAPPQWRLKSPEGILTIPETASGTDALFDAFTTLPGLAPERLLRARNAPGRTTVWTRAARLPERL